MPAATANAAPRALEHRERLARYRNALGDLRLLIERNADRRTIAHALQLLMQDLARSLVALYDAPDPEGAEGRTRALALGALEMVRNELRARGPVGSERPFHDLVLRAERVLADCEATLDRS